jgi:hypothetical protein
MTIASATISSPWGIRYIRAAIVAFVAAWTIGCVRAPRPTGYFQSYDGLVRQPLTYMGVYAERTPAAKQARLDYVLQILPSRWDAARLPEPALEKQLLDLLDDRLLFHFQRLAPPSIIVTQHRDIEYLENRGATITQLRFSITDVAKGVGILRPLLGAFYIGPTELQVEGQLVDSKTQQVLTRLARRGLGTGVAYGLMTPQSVSSKFCWRLSIDETAKEVARYIVPQLHPPPANWWERRAKIEGKSQK